MFEIKKLYSTKGSQAILATRNIFQSEAVRAKRVADSTENVSDREYSLKTVQISFNIYAVTMGGKEVFNGEHTSSRVGYV